MRSSPGPPAQVRIGALVFDAGRRQLVGEGGPVELPVKEFELLVLLVSRMPRVVSKEEIRDALWPHTVVTDASLTSLVRELRAKLGQAGRKGPIRTVHGFGYALSAEGPVPQAAAGPRLVRGTAEIAIGSPQIVLGREPGLPGTIDADSVSRRHARLDWDGATATLSDLGSKNGTFVNGVRLAGPVRLEDEDEVRFGLVTFTYRAPRTGRSTTKTVA
jgi:DNA-binding winged helix-turn-helix (wHTH) protein